MSIVTEIQRLQIAKEGIRDGLIARGATVPEESTVESFPDILRGCPYSIRGYFTPEVDTTEFEVKDLPFKPRGIVVSNYDLYIAPITGGLINYGQMDGTGGIIGYGSSTAGKITTATVVPNSSVIIWGENSFSMTMPANTFLFKSGYTYEYVISGGFG